MKRLILLILVVVLAGCSFVTVDGTTMYVVDEEHLRQEYKSGVGAGCAAGAMGGISMFADPRTYTGLIVVKCVEEAEILSQDKYPQPTPTPTVNEELEDIGVEFSST